MVAGNYRERNDHYQIQDFFWGWDGKNVMVMIIVTVELYTLRGCILCIYVSVKFSKSLRRANLVYTSTFSLTFSQGKFCDSSTYLYSAQPLVYSR